MNRHPQGQCPQPAERLRIVGDPHRSVVTLCPECKAIYSGAPFAFTFVPADTPEWVQRAAEKRLPPKVAA